MRHARAPKGFFTKVDIRVQLKGTNRLHEAHWDTPLAIKPAYHKALWWIDDELKAAGVKGRTTVQRIQVEVKYEEGEYVDEA